MSRIKTLAMMVFLPSVLASIAGVLRGTVEDALGEYIVGDEVRLRNQITSQEFSTSVARPTSRRQLKGRKNR